MRRRLRSGKWGSGERLKTRCEEALKGDERVHPHIFVVARIVDDLAEHYERSDVSGHQPLLVSKVLACDIILAVNLVSNRTDTARGVGDYFSPPAFRVAGGAIVEQARAHRPGKQERLLARRHLEREVRLINTRRSKFRAELELDEEATPKGATTDFLLQNPVTLASIPRSRMFDAETPGSHTVTEWQRPRQWHGIQRRVAAQPHRLGDADGRADGDPGAETATPGPVVHGQHEQSLDALHIVEDAMVRAVLGQTLARRGGVVG